ncbi:MAG: hypothetical protein ACE5G8_07500, partial [Anaerolineae bacterium]
TYLETLSVDKGVNLSGGYESSGWTQDVAQYPTVIDGSGNRTVPGDWDGNSILAPSVISDAGQFKMWYTGFDLFGSGRLGQATSANGIDWAKSGSNPLLGGLFEVAVLKEGPGDYKMWYTSDDGSIYRATSVDGLNWITATTPVFSPSFQTGTFDRDLVSDPSIVQDGSGVYWMFYEAGNWNGNWNQIQIGAATSPDGLTWTRVQTTPVITAGGPGAWDEQWALDPMARWTGNGFELWYSGVDISGTRRIGYATSTDGVNWSKSTANPVLQGDAGQWDDGRAGNFFVLLDGGVYKMWYHSNGQLGYATSTDGVNWSKFTANPAVGPAGGHLRRGERRGGAGRLHRHRRGRLARRRRVRHRAERARHHPRQPRHRQRRV